MYIIVLAHRLFWLVLLAWFATASWFAAANLLQGGSEEMNSTLLFHPVVVAIGAAGAAAGFATILVRDMLKGRGAACLWQSLKGSRCVRVDYFLAYDLGEWWGLSDVSGGQQKSRWRLLNIRWLTIPVIMLAVIAISRFDELLGWMSFPTAVVFTVGGMVMIANALWRPEPEVWEGASR